MSHRLVLGALMAALVGLVVFGATRGSAQLASLLGPEKEAMVYDGEVKTDAGGIKLTSWGSGKAEPLSDGLHYFVGPEVLKVSTGGPYQGVVLRLGRPVDLTPFLSSKNGFIELRLMPAQPKRVKLTLLEKLARRNATNGNRASGNRGPGGASPGGTRSGGGGGRGRMGGAVSPGTPLASHRFQVELTQGRRGMGEGGGAGMIGGNVGRSGLPGGRPTTGPGTKASEAQEIGFSAHNLRVVCYTEAGPMVANAIPLEQGTKDDRGWYRVSWPLARFSQVTGASQLQAVGLFSDEAEQFYLGQIRLIVDRQAVKATLKAEPTITATNRVIEFSLECTGGAIDPEVSWDFNDIDGLQRQAVGPKVKYVYKKPGDYIITATLEDRSGIQPKVTKSIGVHVEKNTEPGESKPVSSGLGEKKEPVIEVR